MQWMREMQQSGRAAQRRVPIPGLLLHDTAYVLTQQLDFVKLQWKPIRQR